MNSKSTEDLDFEKHMWRQSMEDQMSFARTSFYVTTANTTVRFDCGKTLKFHKEPLIIKSNSEVIHRMFQGNRQQPEIINIPDVDYDRFKLFLDCTMNFEPLKFYNCCKIFRLACLYQSQELISKCITTFLSSPGKFTDFELCEVLNRIARNNAPRCRNHILLSFKGRFKIFEKYIDQLNPNTIRLILENIKMDSFLLKIITNWAVKYVENISPSPTLKKFLEENDLLKFFKLENFETRGAITDYCRSKPGNEVFSAFKVLIHFLGFEDLHPGKSEWKVMKKNETIKEEIIMPTMPNYFGDRTPRVQIGKNKVVFYGNIEEEEKGKDLIRLDVNFLGVTDDGSDLYNDEGRFYYWNKKDFDGFAFHRYRGEGGQKFSSDGCVLKMTWTFLQDCRVLLVNRQGDKLNGAENLYFSKDVTPIC